ncbi:ABC transporter ATP-binding protein [Shimia sp. Alg240-R146]|uniref:ABC transporter ATP-binding protein n=1 Tax=Shimia sp. Alg240-R146 TaxID=2993449 RepID=UPI0022E2FB7B|nr:sn-glycerol-3-phosphate ABC transporter ATP-binding protein UgpC [Shimia sp. Alg240-R146]
MADLTLNNVKKSYGAVEVIKGVSMQVKHGEFCVFVGPSGCGKSTLLRMISGLEDITDGTCEIDGEVVNNLGAADRGLAMVFQSYALYPHMSVRQNLTFGLENLKTAKAEITAKTDQVAKMLQIDELLDRRPKDLSGGQRQRVAIGRAVVREPRVFLFDEPLSNLDAELRVEMRGEISRLHGRLGNTMIYVTHDQVEAMTMADKIAVLRAGEVEQFGRPLDLYNTPANMFVAGFIGSPRMNFFAGTVSGADLILPKGDRLALPATGFDITEGAAVTLGVRPDGLKVVSADATGPHDIHAEVVTVEKLGGESYLYALTAEGEKITVHSQGQTTIREGDKIALAVATDALHLFDTDSGKSHRRDTDGIPT